MRIKQNSVTSIIFWHFAIQDLEGTSNDQNASQGKVYPLSTYCINWIIQKINFCRGIDSYRLL